MKKLYVLFLGGFFLTLPNLLSAQSEEQRKLVSLDKASISCEWIDPYFPIPNSPEEIMSYSAKMEEYAKEHPAFPVLIIANPTPEQIEQYILMVEKWIQQFGEFFPVFVEYSKFNRTLSSKDDYSIYFAAREEWIKRNPERASQLEEEVGYWISNHQKEYEALTKEKSNREEMK